MTGPDRRGLDAIDLQVLVGALRAACDEMGAVLIRSAHSVNITERRDCSTALFDAAGRMIAQAEHIPVHLGAMPASVAAVRDAGGRDLAPGVSWILNDPFAGGSHLPDITVVTPVFADPDEGPDQTAHASAGVRREDGPADGDGPQAAAHTRRLIGFAAARAHHADVGGSTPGSMPANSTSLDEEGVVIAPVPLTAGLIDALAGQMRHPAQRRADLRAQQAACVAGAARLTALARARGAERLATQVDDVLAYGERRMAAAIGSLPAGVHRRTDVLEARDAPIELGVVVTVAPDRVTVDLRDAPDQGHHNLNCPRAVTESACLFAIRAAVGDAELPTDDGTRRRIEVLTRPGSLLDARPWPDGSRPAVVAGNVETSSRVADLVLGALGRALGQGTMNNVTLGDESRTMYETIAGGQGARHRRRPHRRPRGDVEHPQHPDRGARGEFPGAGGAVRGPPGKRRRRPLPRRRRRGPRAAGARAARLPAPDRAAEHGTPGRGRRRGR